MLRNAVTFLGAPLLLAVPLATATAASVPAPAISVEGAWSRPALPGMSTGVIYLTVVNHGRGADRLTGASSPMAAHVGLHRSAMSGGVSTMEAVKAGLEVPAHGTARLEPNGYHLMMMGLKGGLSAGSSFPASLVFAHAGAVKITVQVRATPPG
ncbi:MAG: copper chaperone PCu(A)C [Caulobacteraceae bacterium]